MTALSITVSVAVVMLQQEISKMTSKCRKLYVRNALYIDFSFFSPSCLWRELCKSSSKIILPCSYIAWYTVVVLSWSTRIKISLLFQIIRRHLRTGKKFLMSETGTLLSNKSFLLRNRICSRFKCILVDAGDSKAKILIIESSSLTGYIAGWLHGEETYNWCLFEPLRVTYWIPYCHRILHLILDSIVCKVAGLRRLSFVTYRIFIFHQALVIAAEADKEKYAGDILEAMYPFSPFALLTANINHW